MKGMLLGIAVLLLLVFTATDSQAQCVRCGIDFYGCTSCIPTFYNANVLCSLQDFGVDATFCTPVGECDGYLGDNGCGGSKAPGCNLQLAEDWRGPHLPYRSGEWKLVSVTLKRGPAGPSSL